MTTCCSISLSPPPPVVPSKNCRQLYEEGHLTSGVYTLYPRDRLGPFNVFCHMGLSPAGSDRGWTVVQRRLNADVDFNRSKEEYQFGFGQLEGNFWLGLENIKRLVDKATDGHQLYVEVKYDNYIVSKGLWDSFSLESSNTDWKIRISGVNKVVSSGIVLDLLGDVDGRKFGAMDSSEKKACAVKVGGGWWFGESCPSESACYPNGHYSSGSDGLDAGIRGKLEIETLTLRTVVMAIRTR